MFARTNYAILAILWATWVALATSARGDVLPFDQTIEIYRDDETEVIVFALRLEQPFLAGEFEKSGYLRLQPLDDNAWLVYPRETRFEQKHAEFYGRLRRSDPQAAAAELKLSYEIVGENLDGSRRVDVREATISIPIPTEDAGSARLYRAWAEQQNAYFAELLRYYPEDTFLEYVLLQSQARYGVDPPRLPSHAVRRQDNDANLYQLFSGGLAVQQALQREALSQRARGGDHTAHISELTPPALKSLDYEQRLEDQQKKGVLPRPHAAARLVPADQYLFHFRSFPALEQLLELSDQWGDNLLRMLRVSAEDHRLRQKYCDQLGVRFDQLEALFAAGVVDEFALTGSDFFLAEGTDLTAIVHVREPAALRAAVEGWQAEAKARFPEFAEREFNYRGRTVTACYTPDRALSSFVIYEGEYAILSTSHRAIRRVIDTSLGEIESLAAQRDYQYVTALLPPLEEAETAYLYGSEAFLRRLVSPAFKIAEKRRRQAFTNLVMLNNASLFYRMEYDRSPDSLSDLADGKFVDLARVVDPSGGAYAFDPQRDTATSSIYNRIKYLTPILELDVLKVSPDEQREYEQYRARYEAQWRPYFDPIAVRLQASDKAVRLETLVLPFANGSLYEELRQTLDVPAQPLESTAPAATTVVSLALLPGRERLAQALRSAPGVAETLQANPTLTDLAWLGDRVSWHFCDDDTIIEIDPLQIRPLSTFVPLSTTQQTLAAAALTAMNLPGYATIAVEDQEKARLFLDQLVSQMFLQSRGDAELSTRLDAYQLPDYDGHAIYAVTVQVYAVKLRLFLALVGGDMVTATDHDALLRVIDASKSPPAEVRPAHAMLRFRFEAMHELKKDLHTYWAEQARIAAHRNIMPLYTLARLYDVSVDEANRMADAKYGVTYFCPGGGQYVYDPARDQIESTVFGHRRHARQTLALDDKSPFHRFFASLQEATATLRFVDDGLLATLEIERKTNGDRPASQSP